MRIARICLSLLEAETMLFVHPDFDHQINLPGAGLCSRPVDIDRTHTGFSELVSLRIYSFAEGVVIDGQAEEDEVFIVLLRGRADVTVLVDGPPSDSFQLQRGGGSRAIYMPPHSSYQLSAISECDIAYARAMPTGEKMPPVLGFTPSADRLDIIGHALGMELMLATVAAGRHSASFNATPSPERFIHVRSDGAVTATIGGEAMGNWDSVALSAGESALLTVHTGTVDVLTICATRCDRVHQRPQ